MQKQKGASSLIFIIIIVVLLAIAGYFAYKFYTVQKPSAQPEVQNQNENQTQTPAQLNNVNTQTAGWKTYKNTEYGFEIQYPNSMGIQNSNNGVSLVSVDNQRKVDIKVESIKPGQDCRKTVWVADTPNIIIDNATFVGVGSGLKDAPYYGVLYCTIRGGFDYIITSHLFHVSGGPNNFPEDDTVLNQIISTFKFTK